ncbi:DDE-domain-containing protein, partial [Schizophyllum commune H4-8]|uniref:DDE-domain-containing protein n=1 Tax=Schizophyllum commune (strain H4-8 / FGSC 9210) TaxID=578458 RepID=UPI00215F9819
MPRDESSSAAKTRAVRTSHAPYNVTRKVGRPAKAAKQPKTSAQAPTSTTRPHLTTADWLLVYAFRDANPGLTHTEIVEHFKTRPEGPLLFTQPTLSRKLGTAAREAVESRANATPTGLSSKRDRIVTEPLVEQALVKLCNQFEARGDHYTGDMLQVARGRFEEMFDIPLERRLKEKGWIASFKKTYGISEYARHGEAGSVDLAAVEREKKRLAAELAPYSPDDSYNADETGCFLYALPSRGLATRQMSGKKDNKTRISLLFCVNASGTDKLEPLFIGKAAKPVAFGRKSPRASGFDYENNATAWMTMVIFEKWLKRVDRRMRAEGRHIALTLDNFKGHYVAYKPTNIKLVFFEPNMTSFVQPCDAGVIRCFKAIYRREFCRYALDQHDSDPEIKDVWKMDFKQALIMIRDAWKQVSAETIKNCWTHTSIR